MELLWVVLAAAAFSFVLVRLLAGHIYRDEFYVKGRIKGIFGMEADSAGAEKRRKKNKKKARMQASFFQNAHKSLTTELSLAGVRLRAEEFIGLWAASAFVPAGLLLLAGMDWIAAFALFVLGAILPLLFVRRAKAKRLALFEQQLGDALLVMGNCLRTGLSFQQAIASIANDMPDPISKEFNRVSREVQLGVGIETALENMVERLDSKDFLLLAAAVLIQRQVGGNLSEILDSISDTIRERLKIKANIKVLTATGRSSGLIVGLMPVVIIAILMLANPSYIRLFFASQAGSTMLCIAAGLEVVGFFVVRKVVNIKF